MCKVEVSMKLKLRVSSPRFRADMPSLMLIGGLDLAGSTRLQVSDWAQSCEEYHKAIMLPLGTARCLSVNETAVDS